MTALDGLFARVARRQRGADILIGAAIGFAIAIAMNLAGWPGRRSYFPPFVAGLIGAVETGVFVAWLRRKRRPAPGIVIERRVASSRNLLFTAHELAHAGAETAPARYAIATAEHLAGTIDARAVVPLAGELWIVGVAAAAWLAGVAVATGGTVVGRARSTAAMVDRVDLVVTQPAYAGGASRTIRNPERATVLEGSRIELRLESNAAWFTLSNGDSSRRIAADSRGRVAVPIAARSTTLAIEPHTVDGTAGARRIITLATIPDSAPRVRVTAPGHDDVVPDAHRTIAVTVEATDDIGLSALQLRFTKVTGSGERFTFKDAERPLVVERKSATKWLGRGTIPLDSLGIDTGDLVVYRAVATDNRSGSLPVESDAFIVQLASPGGIAAAGFAVDPEDERSALSQQMIVLKTERLLAAKKAMTPEAYADSAAQLASEQRRVRAEFVFMLGGEMTDAGAGDTSMTTINEEEEAGREDDFAAGREAYRGRVAVLAAIRAMSLAARSLTTADLAVALSHEREAVKQLERAFSRNRIILRALAEREQLDSTRRLTGDLSAARGMRGVTPAVTPDAAVSRLRDLLSELLSATRLAGAPLVTALTKIGDRALRLDAATPGVDAIVRALSDAAGAARAGRDAATRDAMSRAASLLNARIVAAAPTGGVPRVDSAVARFRGARADSLRKAVRGGGR